VEDSAGSVSNSINIHAGNGLTGGGDLSADVTLTVGQGPGIVVNADDVSVDIANQTYSHAVLDDEVMISKVSSNNEINKTKVRDIAALASNPGGIDTQVQYNSNGLFGADSGFTYDGSGNAVLSSTFKVGSYTVDGGAVNIIHFDNSTGSSTPRIQSSGGGQFTLSSATSAGDSGSLAFNSSGPPWITWSFNANNSSVNMSDGTGMQVVGPFPIRRSILNNGTASTTQTQGNGALTRDYNDITTVANDNDTVTLPAGLAGRWCVVRNVGAKLLKVFPASGADLGNGVNTATTIPTGAHAVWVAISATLWHQVDGVMRHSVQSAITAGTTQTQGQVPLTKDVNEVHTVANANDVVTMPTAPAFSRTVTIINNGANILQIFPATGDDLGAGVNTSVTLAAGANVRYTNYDVTNWEAI
jgi:2-keto-3-deoxy-6-phosphogluconate aldolase